jgi:hypothetical protein
MKRRLLVESVEKEKKPLQRRTREKRQKGGKRGSEFVWLTCGDGGLASEETFSELRLFFLAVAAATVAAELFAQPTMKPMEPTFVADN